LGRMIRKKIKSYTLSAKKPYEKKTTRETYAQMRGLGLWPGSIAQYFFIT